MHIHANSFFTVAFFIISGVTVSFEQSSYSLTEGNIVQVCALLSSESALDITVTVNLSITGGTAVQNSDYVLPGQVLTFMTREMRSCVFAGAINDAILEEDESFTLMLESNNMAVLISPTNGVTTVMIPNQNSEYIIVT